MGLLFATDFPWSSLAAPAAIALLVLTLMSFGRRSAKRRDAFDRSPASGTGGAPEILDDRLPCSAELVDLVRDTKAEIDTKLCVLQTLISMAQAETDRLNAAIAEARRLGLTPWRDSLDALDRLIDESAADSAPDLELPPLSAAVRGRLAVAPDVRARVETLADQGQSVATIADRTGLPRGDIELLLSLRAGSP